jgi:hypothetical protein
MGPDLMTRRQGIGRRTCHARNGFLYGSIIPGPRYIRPGRKELGEGEIRWSATTGRAKTE